MSGKARIFLPSNKKKPKPGSSGTPPASNAQSSPYLRPMTPVCTFFGKFRCFCTVQSVLFQTSAERIQCFVVLKESLRKQPPSSPAEPVRAIQHQQRSSSPIPSPLQTRRTHPSDANPWALENGVQLSQSVPDLRSGIRHFRSSSQPVRPVAASPHRESFSSVTFPDRSNSVNSETSYYTEAAEAPMIVQEDIIALTVHVRTFSEALSSLRNTFIECEGKVLFTTAESVVYSCIKSTFFYS